MEVSLGADKTVFTILGCAEHDAELVSRKVELFVGDTKLTYQQRPKFLGVTLDPELNME